MLKFNMPLETQLREFWQWWSGELLALVPAGLRQLLGSGGEYLVLSRDGQGVALWHRRADGETRLASLPLDDTGETARLRFLQEHPKLDDLAIVLKLENHQGLRKQIKLPMAAAENLQQVIAFEMDRMTPFKSDQVYFSALVASRLKATRQIVVDLVLTPKTKLDSILEDLTAAGWRPERVYLDGETRIGSYDLLPEKFRPPHRRLPGILNGILAGLIVTLLTLVAIVPLWSANNEVKRLQDQVKKTARIAQEVESMREQAEKLQHQARFLQDRKHVEPVLLDMLEELTRVIPDGTWLNGLQYANRRLIVQGQSPSASSLLQRIETSAFFRNVSFVSPVTKDTSNGLERFQIAGDAVNGRFSEKSR